MKLSNKFIIQRPREKLWALFQDVPRVATCIPGARLTEDIGGGKFKGRIEVKLGPISTVFEGDAAHVSDLATHTGTITGNGRDRNASSRAKFTTTYRLAEMPTGTEVEIESDITLAGAVAQFGRTGLLQEVTSRILEQFAANLERQIASEGEAAETDATPPASPTAQANLGGILLASLLAWLRSLIGRLLGRTN
ncbi:MAG TPA: SRPBCC family protein [Gammaproteobacteria bacterium]|nr:SRPBCC family protein [Gammaproteobacteria bacterium]